jgi:antirestriction protein ArdC
MASVYEIITERIVTQLKAGTIPWRKPWSNVGGFPKNLVSGKKYRGINLFLLYGAPFELPFWVTYKQAQELGGQVRKGEHGLPVIFWKWFDEDKEPQEADEAGRSKRRAPVIRYYTVFNVAQCDGIAATSIPATAHPLNDNKPIERCEHIVRGMPRPPRIRQGMAGPCYWTALDAVDMPSLDRFTSAEEYYATLFHELTHATGHKSRLGRPGFGDASAVYGSPVYSREELIAEMGSAFLCGHAGIAGATLQNAAAYVAGWLQTLKADNTLAVLAAAQAQKAADYILDVKHAP